jgi:thiol-disulfide isomerase/thioredoxin
MRRSYLLLTFFCAGITLLFFSGASLAPPGWAAPSRSTLTQDDAFDDAMDRARLHFNRRNYEEALKYYKRANKLKGENCTDCLWGMAQTYSKLGADKNVIETCERLAQAAAGDNELAAKAHNLKGITLAAMAMEKMEKPDLKKLADAEATFRLALAAYPETKIVHYNLGVTLIRLGREADGIRELKAYVEHVDEDSESAEDARKIIENPRRARENFAPDFTATTADGEYIDSDELRGKIVLVDFWGTWCGPCRESIPALASLAKKFSKDPFVLLSVDWGDEPGVWRTFIEKNKMTWPQHQDRTGKVQRAFQVRSYPTYVLIDHEGVVRYRSTGYSDYVEGMIAGAIKKSLKTAAKAGPPPKAQAAPAASISSAPSPAQSAPAAQLSSAPQAGEEQKPRELPVPVLEVTGAETMDAGGMKITRFYLSLKNWADYPEVLFAPMPDLPPCSFNTTPTRIQVIVWSEDQRPLTTYCNVPDRSLLQRLQVMSRMQGESTPARVYVTLEDRRAQRILRSKPVPLVPPAPRTP